MLTILGHQNQLHPQKLTTIGVVAVLMLVLVIAYYLWARHLSLSYPPYHFALFCGRADKEFLLLVVDWTRDSLGWARFARSSS
ncbi:MAG: hypothetical protein BRC44_05285 [Cyanobacteria bacterium QS_4_48_99]|nr:MAG: hypothetical protein BRC44_05285 [Cyanobacteria bacterium QS_4_48_99]